MKRSRWILLLSLIFVACQTREAFTPQPTPILTPVLSAVHLTSDSANRVIELITLSGKSSSSVSALSFNANSEEVIAFHSERGILNRWRIKDSKLLTTTQLVSAGATVAAFDGQAERLAVGSGSVCPAADTGSVTSEGTRVWDTHLEEMIFSTRSISISSRLPILPITDVALSPDGNWLVEAGSGSLSGWDLVQERPIVGIALGLDFGEEPGFRTRMIDAVTTDASGEWFAYATHKGKNAKGEITIEDRKTWNLLDDEFWKKRFIWQGRTPDGEIPVALRFNPSRTVLAALTTKSLIVWDLRALWGGTEILHEPALVSCMAALVFSPDGGLLATGSDNGWQIWSVTDKKLLYENKMPTGAIAFSPDGRLFAWGDANGVVHIWGVRE